MPTPSVTCDASLLLLVLFAAWSDARTGLIPNYATLPVLALAPAWHLVDGGAGGLAASVLSTMACGLVPLVMFQLRAMGGGDVKLLAAIGALSLVRDGIAIQLTAYMLGAVIAVFGLWRRGLFGAVLRRALARVFRRRRMAAPGDASDVEQPTQRLGVPILLATLGVLGARSLLRGAWP